MTYSDPFSVRGAVYSPCKNVSLSRIEYIVTLNGCRCEHNYSTRYDTIARALHRWRCLFFIVLKNSHAWLGGAGHSPLAGFKV